MKILAIDVGSSSIKAGYFKHGRLREYVRVSVTSTLAAREVEIPAVNLIETFERAIRKTLRAHNPPDAIVLDTFSPGLVGIDKNGRPIVGCITHQDRRSIQQAHEIERRVGRERHLAITGNRPFPGGIASTSLLWLKERQPDRFKRISRIGQPTTLLIDHLTGRWVIDPSQAAFLGLYESLTLAGWSREICQAVGVREAQLPQVLFADEIAGKTLPAISHHLGLRPGTPVYASLVDTGAAMLATPAIPGTLVHSAGSSDVLALCLDTPQPADDILTRPLGTGKKLPRRWLAVSTIAAGGSTMKWIRDNMFSDRSGKKFSHLIARIGEQLSAEKIRPNLPSADCEAQGVPIFEPYLAGDRTSMEDCCASFANLTLATDREAMLLAVITALVQSSKNRFLRLRQLGPLQPVIYTMGGQAELARIMHRAWPGHWKFEPLKEGAFGGLTRIIQDRPSCPAGHEGRCVNAGRRPS